MRIVIQRVRRAAVVLADESPPAEAGRIGPGILALVGFAPGDTDDTLAWMAARIAGLRIFPGDRGEMDRSVRDIDGGLLLVSQFTLYADVRKGRRPDFTAAAPYPEAEVLFDRFRVLCEAELPGHVASGVFGARMDVSLVNDGPVTLILER